MRTTQRMYCCCYCSLSNTEFNSFLFFISRQNCAIFSLQIRLNFFFFFFVSANMKTQAVENVCRRSKKKLFTLNVILLAHSFFFSYHPFFSLSHAHFIVRQSMRLLAEKCFPTYSASQIAIEIQITKIYSYMLYMLGSLRVFAF